MFLDIDSLKKQSLMFSRGETWFVIDGERVPFDEISEFYRTSTEHYTNRVFQGTCLRVELRFSSERKAEVYEVDSNHLEHYRLLLGFTEAIEAFRKKRLEADYRSRKQLGFSMRGEAKAFRLKETVLLLGDEQVEALRFCQQGGMGVVEFVLPERSFAVEVADISDSELFMELTLQVVPSSVKPPSRMKLWLDRAFWAWVLCFGVNGWLDEFALALWMDNPLVEGLSVVARILLVVVIVLRPFFWLVGLFNEKMIARQPDRLNPNQ